MDDKKKLKVVFDIEYDPWFYESVVDVVFTAKKVIETEASVKDVRFIRKDGEHG